MRALLRLDLLHLLHKESAVPGVAGRYLRVVVEPRQVPGQTVEQLCCVGDEALQDTVAVGVGCVQLQLFLGRKKTASSLW